ncbi:MAG TPA: methyltransferase domain-containing protein [Herpetosiphonaceae bacterium]
MELDRLRRIYRDYAPGYDDSMRLSERLLLDRFRRELLQKARGDVLEVAIGTGIDLPYYPSGCRITGLDLVPEMLVLAAVRARTLKLPLRQVIADVAHLPYPDRSFDTVVTTLAACTFPDPIAALREMGRVCREDGHVLLLEHVRGNSVLFGRILDWLTPYTVASIGCNLNRDTAANATIAGLRIITVRAIFGGLLVQIEAQPAQKSQDTLAAHPGRLTELAA